MTCECWRALEMLISRRLAPCAVPPLTSTRRRAPSLTANHPAPRAISHRLAPCAVQPFTT
eukprot:143837-Pleurochrysis_carterae.AAC.2